MNEHIHKNNTLGNYLYSYFFSDFTNQSFFWKFIFI